MIMRHIPVRRLEGQNVKPLRRALLLLLTASLMASAGLGTAPAQDKTKQKIDPKAKVDPKTAGDQKSKGDAKAKAVTAGLSFELYKDAGDKFRWRLKDGEGNNIGMAPRGYDTKAECQKMIDAIKAGAAQAKVADES
jgi:uncharacterized protein YegP (UPF0339 family)